MHAQAIIHTARLAPLHSIGTSSLSLLASFVAICSTLPVLWVALGLDAGDLLTVTLAHKEFVFVISGTMLLCAAWATRGLTTRRCPPDPESARHYRRIRHWNRRTLKLSSLLWLAGVIAAYLAPPVHALLAR